VPIPHAHGKDGVTAWIVIAILILALVGAVLWRWQAKAKA
jgi:membrane protein DedA with SNARE-associated domain